MEKDLTIFEKNEQSSVDYVIEKQKKVRLKAKMRRFKRRLFFIFFVLGFSFIIIFYFVSDISKVHKITIVGNYYLSNEYISDLSGINYESRYLFVIEPFIQSNLNKDPLIANAKVQHLNNGVIQINIQEEKAIGYRYTDQPEIVLANYEIIKMEEQYTDIIAYLPLIEGFKEPEIFDKLIRAFESVEMKTIGMISEIHHYSDSYDDNKIRFVMRDGKRVFSGFFTLEVLNFYPDYGSISINQCIYIDEMSKVPYSSKCPGEIAEEKKASEEKTNSEETN